MHMTSFNILCVIVLPFCLCIFQFCLLHRQGLKTISIITITSHQLLNASEVVYFTYFQGRIQKFWGSKRVITDRIVNQILQTAGHFNYRYYYQTLYLCEWDRDGIQPVIPSTSVLPCVCMVLHNSLPSPRTDGVRPIVRRFDSPKLL